METVATILVGDTSDARVESALASLGTLGHREIVSARRRYEFPDGTKAEAFGMRTEIMAYQPTPIMVDPRATVETRRSVRVPSLSWSDSRFVDDTVVKDFLITHRARVRLESPRVAVPDSDASTGSLVAGSLVVAVFNIGETFREDVRSVVDALIVADFDTKCVEEGVTRVKRCLESGVGHSA